MFPRSLLLLTAFIVTLRVTFSLDEEDVNRVIKNCQNKVKRLASKEDKYVAGERAIGEPVLTGTPFNELLRMIYPIQQRQFVFECISDKLKGNTDEDLEEFESYRNLKENCTAEKPAVGTCDPSSKYQTINGTCNNLDNPRWGSTLDCFRRLYPANFIGVSGLRKSVLRDKNGERRRPLPTPRTASLKLAKPKTNPTNEYNNMFVLFGQAVVHDLAEILPVPIKEIEQVDCCRFAGKRDQYPECIPMMIRRNDPFYSSQNVSCLGVTRAAVCQTCSVDKREQLSKVSAYIDGSLVYGQTEYRTNLLRRNDGSGKMQSQETDGGELMPPDKELKTRCSRPEQGPKQEEQYCFFPGDTRANQHAVLAMYHTILLREHNRLAEALKDLNPHWGEEKLFQEARKILIAEFQVIIYREYLPILIGRKLMDKYDLNIVEESEYNSTLDPTVSIEFNAAAFRVHSLINGKIVDGEDYDFLKDIYVNDVPLYVGRMEAFLMKMTSFPGEKFDWYLPTDVTDWLYREDYGTYGYDLAALDILRGRDTGIPTYSQVIEYMEDRPGTIKSFDDLEPYLVPQCLDLLKKTYSDVRDIDLWAALNCEKFPKDMIISPMAAEIIAEQFYRTKFGDRFFITHDKTLTDAQRETILDNASLAKMVCDNTKVNATQPMMMLFPGPENKPRPCSEYPDVDLEQWRE